MSESCEKCLYCSVCKNQQKGGCSIFAPIVIMIPTIMSGRKERVMDDLISRKAAIDALHTWFRDGFDEDKWWNSTHVLAAIEGLPSVQQEHKWETCFECPLSHGCPKIKGCTNEQAIEYASQIPNDCPLSAQPVDKDISVPNNDIISRQAAIKAIAKMMPKSYTPDGSHPADEDIFRSQEIFADCIKTIEILPSAQLAQDLHNSCTDTISRQAAIDAHELLLKDCNPDHFVAHEKFIGFMDDTEIGSFGDWQFANGFNLALTAGEVAIKEQPSAERKKGRWLPDNRVGGGYWVCSCCKFPSEAFAASVLYKFCPNCGAEMKGEHDG